MTTNKKQYHTIENTIIDVLVNMEEKHHKRSLGGGYLQKMVYLCSSSKNKKYYNLFHYGVYSKKVEEYIHSLEQDGIINKSWKEYKGYLIKLNKRKISNLKLNKKIEETVKKYGELNIKELENLTTSIYLQDKAELIFKRVQKSCNKNEFIKPGPQIDVVDLLREINI